jgi:hypothetical protein
VTEEVDLVDLVDVQIDLVRQVGAGNAVLLFLLGAAE